ncbi:hypothetical protein ADJ79_12680 [Ottowia sp. oral taxon 894]|nr:hypothetical protein ADJ79_12680 [Ottowia sp. oral taxon 894]
MNQGAKRSKKSLRPSTPAPLAALWRGQRFAALLKSPAISRRKQLRLAGTGNRGLRFRAARHLPALPPAPLKRPDDLTGKPFFL